MNRTIPLCDLSSSRSGTVLKINTPSDLADRLADFGLIEGCQISSLITSPFGDPTAYRINNTVFALRHADSAKIIICIDGSNR